VTPFNDFASELNRFRNNFQELAQGIQGERVIFLVGAGISFGAPTNIETAKELVLRLKEKFGVYDWWAEYFDPSSPNAGNKFYDEAFQLPKLEEIAELFLSRGEFRLFIDSLMEEKIWETKPPNICHTVLSELLIEEICEGVLTTNVDDRIENEHRRISARTGPNVISHDDFVADQGHRNNIYKIHGCLYKCPNRKYDSIWATSQLSSVTWPTGLNFAESLIRSFCQRCYLVFVGFNTPAGYLKRTLAEAIQNNENLKFYCVLPCDFDSIDPEFREMICLSEDRFIQLCGEDFFSLVRQIVFEERLNGLFRDGEGILQRMMKYFNGGDERIYQIEASEFEAAKESVKNEIIKQDRDFFQRFLGEVLQEQGHRDKYVSFRYASDQIARLFYWLAVFRFNYEEFTFCKTSSRHLLMHKENKTISLLIVDGHKEKPLDLIYQQLNRTIEEDREFMYDIRNVFVYDASEYNGQAATPEKVGSGRLVERDPNKIVNASSVRYFPLTDQEINKFLREFALEGFKQNLDAQPWRL
jgi:NAD-dependent SIR2 family protein deacetylase